MKKEKRYEKRFSMLLAAGNGSQPLLAGCGGNSQQSEKEDADEEVKQRAAKQIRKRRKLKIPGGCKDHILGYDVGEADI